MEWNPETPIRMSGVVRDSIVDGIGVRYTVFVQGCPHHCKGCHNPETHDPNGGYENTVGALFKDIAKQKYIKGVTFSGGEPFAQTKPLLMLAKHLKESEQTSRFDLTCYSGWTLKQLLKKSEDEPEIKELLLMCDVLVDGAFVLSKRSLALAFRGSTNQRLLFKEDILREITPNDKEKEG